jgi:predicted dehydrogenase
MTASLAIVGTGWRSQFILDLAAALPERFEIVGVTSRTRSKSDALAARYGVPAFDTLDELLAHRRPDFLVLSVAGHATPALIGEAHRAGIPVLTETPPAGTIDDLVALWNDVGSAARVQVAEQYHLQPLHAAQIALARSGVLGDVGEARVSISHGYHAVSVMRRLLDVGYDDATITALPAVSWPLVGGPGRGGDPVEETTVENEQVLAQVDFGGRIGVYDWSSAQNRSWIRGPRTLTRGDRGEIDHLEVRYLKDFRTPVQYTLRRVEGGQFTNMEDKFLRGILAGDTYVDTNEFAPARLIDDEIAVARCLVGMADYAAGGEGFYSLAEASQDHYIGLEIMRAHTTGERIRTTRQPWAAA